MVAASRSMTGSKSRASGRIFGFRWDILVSEWGAGTHSRRAHQECFKLDLKGERGKTRLTREELGDAC